MALLYHRTPSLARSCDRHLRKDTFQNLQVLLSLNLRYCHARSHQYRSLLVTYLRSSLLAA